MLKISGSPILILLFILLPHNFEAKKEYVKYYYENGNLKAQGWIINNQKTAYWYEYTSSGRLKSKGPYHNNLKSGYWYFYNKKEQKSSEGHFKRNLKTGWWIYIMENGDLVKTQYSLGKKNGLALYYHQGKSIPYKAERYDQNNYLGTWKSYSQFKKDNPNFKYKKAIQ